LLIREKGHWEALIVELGSPNYAKVGAKMMDLEGNEVDVPGATDKGPWLQILWGYKIPPHPQRDI
jgi:hypothetical protein